MPDPTAAAPWTVTLAWTPDQNFGAVSTLTGRAPLHAVMGLLNAGETVAVVAAEHGLSGEEVAVLDRLRQELGGPQGPEPAADEVLLVRLPGRGSGRVTVGHSRLTAATVLRLLADATPATVAATYPSLTVSGVSVLAQLAQDIAHGEREPVDLDTLTGWVELALESSAIEVDVYETDQAGSRAGMSVEPLRRLTRCLRSAGLLDEHADGESPTDSPDVPDSWGLDRAETPTDDDLTAILDRWVPPATIGQVRDIIRGLLGRNPTAR